MKSFKTSLRLWIALSSLTGFFGGWSLLAHSGKPSNTVVVLAPTLQAQQSNLPLPTLEPIPTLSADVAPIATLQPIPALAPNPQLPMPLLRTGGS
jgi:hypothetical protein